MKAFDNYPAANDEGLAERTEKGRLVWDLLRHRVQSPRPGADIFPRPALTERICKAIEPGSILHIEAPAGYGKSRELESALLSSGRELSRVRWVSLQDQDNDPQRLFMLLSLALGVSDADFDSVPVPGRGQSLNDGLEWLLANLANSGEATEVLVLDRVDRVQSQDGTALLTQLLDRLPPGLALVLLSRQALSFETHSYELGGRFTRLTADTLELSRSETAAFYQPLLERQQVTQIAVEHLYHLTEGWLTPLALYRLEVEERGEDRLPVQEARSVVAFLRSAVTAELTPAQGRSLAVMAEMDVVSDDLFLAIADSQCDTSFLPSTAMARGLPLRSAGNRGRWFRLLPLVREWLLSTTLAGRKARATLASDWFAREGQFTEALRYALQCHDTERAIRVASEGSEALLIGQDTASLLRLRQSLPAELIQRSPRLQIVYAWVHALGGQFAEACALIDGMSAEDQRLLQGRLSALRAFLLSGEGNVRAALKEADQALATDDLSTHARLVAQLVRSGAWCALGRFADARSASREASKLARQAGDPGAEILTVYAHARIEMSKGALRHAEQLLRTGLDTSVSEPARPPRVGEGRLMLNLALILWHQGRAAEVDRLLTRFIRHAEKGRDLALLLALALRALLSKSQGQVEEAFAWIGQAERTMQAWQVDELVYVPVLEALKTSCWLAQGQLESARQAMVRLAPFRKQHRVLELFPMMPGLLDTLETRVALVAGDESAAIGQLQEQYSKEELTRHPYIHQLHVVLLQAQAHQRLGQSETALTFFQQALEMAAPEHYISPFIELREEIREVAREGLAGRQPGPLVDALRTLFQLEAEASARPPAVDLPEPISDREFGVLELIAMGLSNQEIADRLHISLHTVKTHARRINAKLGVRSRTQAIVKARELGLL